MLVKDIMTAKVECSSVESTLQETLDKMKDLRSGKPPTVPCGENASAITARDVGVFGSDTVSRARDIIACREDDGIEQAAKLMGIRKSRWLPVVDDRGRLNGVITIEDLAPHLEQSLLDEVLMELSR